MFPDFRYLIHGLTGLEAPQWFSLFKTFGFLVALSFIAATMIMVRELRRKERAGLMLPLEDEIVVGEGPKAMDIAIAAIIGFLLGWKVAGLVLGGWSEAAPDPMSYFVSSKGNVLAGIAVAIVMGAMRYREQKKSQLPEVQKRKVLRYPHERIGEIVIIAAVGGLIGAKVFNAFESWEDFIQDPIGNLISSSGLTFYGGFIVASLVFVWYARKLKVKFAHLADAAAPAIMLAYGIGRLGCQLSGDGDWGIHNSAYITAANGYDLERAASGQYEAVLSTQGYYLEREFGRTTDIPHAAVPATGLPRWMVAQNFPHNVNNIGQSIPACAGGYCRVLPVAVFPTSLYEALTCVLLFCVMWALRKRIRRPWQMFALFLILNGVERFLVEKIRVNYRYDWGFVHPSQAEIISAIMVVSGIALFAAAARKPPAEPPVAVA